MQSVSMNHHNALLEVIQSISKQMLLQLLQNEVALNAYRKAPFIAQQRNSTRRRVELSCVAAL